MNSKMKRGILILVGAVWQSGIFSVQAFQTALHAQSTALNCARIARIAAGRSGGCSTRTPTLLLLASPVVESSPSSSSSVVTPGEGSVVGTIGRGYLPVLLAKLAAHRGHSKSWIVCPAEDADLMLQLASEDGFGALHPNLELVPASDTDRVESLLLETDALMVAADNVGSENGVVTPTILNYLLDPSLAKSMKRVVALSRNLNGDGMGFFVTASKKAANAQVWDASDKRVVEAFRDFESNVRAAAEKCGADWSVVRAGTLKGGGPGDMSAEALEREGSGNSGDESRIYPQYLNESFYKVTKSDIITWQLLFDCNVRGVRLAKGDVMRGPGVKAVFAATGSEEYEGDSSRCSVAEAMVRSLEVASAANVDFGVGTVAGREAPTEEEWAAMFDKCLS